MDGRLLLDLFHLQEVLLGRGTHIWLAQPSGVLQAVHGKLLRLRVLFDPPVELCVALLQLFQNAPEVSQAGGFGNYFPRQRTNDDTFYFKITYLLKSIVFLMYCVIYSDVMCCFS